MKSKQLEKQYKELLELRQKVALAEYENAKKKLIEVTKAASIQS